MPEIQITNPDRPSLITLERDDFALFCEYTRRLKRQGFRPTTTVVPDTDTIQTLWWPDLSPGSPFKLAAGLFVTAGGTVCRVDPDIFNRTMAGDAVLG